MSEPRIVEFGVELIKLEPVIFFEITVVIFLFSLSILIFNLIIMATSNSYCTYIVFFDGYCKALYVYLAIRRVVCEWLSRFPPLFKLHVCIWIFAIFWIQMFTIVKRRKTCQLLNSPLIPQWWIWITSNLSGLCKWKCHLWRVNTRVSKVMKLDAEGPYQMPLFGRYGFLIELSVWYLKNSNTGGK